MESLEQGGGGGGLQSVWDTEIVDYLEPSCVEEELEESEDGDVQIQVMPRVAFGGIQELPSNQARKEERVDSEGDDLAQREGGGETPGLPSMGTLVQNMQVREKKKKSLMHGAGATALSIKC